MNNFNPIEIINLIRQGRNPQQVMMNVLESRMAGTPMGQNLLMLAKQNNTAEIEKIARNFYTQQGKDFDQEFKAFKQMFGFK